MHRLRPIVNPYPWDMHDFFIECIQAEIYFSPSTTTKFFRFSNQAWEAMWEINKWRISLATIESDYNLRDKGTQLN